MSTAIIPTNNVQGDITNCKIETSKINVDKNSAFSLTQITTYRSYDVCTKQTVKEYQVQGFTGFSIFIPLFIFIVIAGFVATTNDY